MARFQQPRRSAFTDPADLEAYDAVVNRGRTMGMATEADDDFVDVGEYFGAMLNSPQLTAITARMGTFVRTAGERPDSYSHTDREFVDQVLCADWKTNVVLKRHIPDALATGVRMAAIKALREGHEEDLTEDEALLAAYVRSVVDGSVDAAIREAMIARLGPRGFVEYTAFILWLQWIIRMMQALDVTSPSDEEIDALIAALDDGSVQVPDFRTRLA